jgi:UDP-glucose 4-epimerase
MNWLVTGGCGFIGVALVQSLGDEGGHTVRIVDNLRVGTREDLRAVCEFVEASPGGVGPMVSGSPVELVVGAPTASPTSSGRSIIWRRPGTTT